MISAQAWIDEMLKTKFPPKTHKRGTLNLSGISESDERKWLGIYKEGD